jgi:hypothetical protein
MTTHPPGWKLELYATGQLALPNSPAVVKMEEHLLGCHRCIDQTERLLAFAQAVRAARHEEPAHAVGV